MSIAALAHRHVFGLKTDVRNNIHYVDDSSVIYPAGNNIVIYNSESKLQKFIPVQESCEAITAMALSPNRRHIAVAERSEVAAVVIYDLLTLRKRKMLPLNQGDAKNVVSMAFSSDSKFIVTQGGPPNWTLYYWTWEKGKAIATIKAVTTKDASVTQASFNPWDVAQVAIIGVGIFKVYKYIDGNMKTYFSAKSENKTYYSHVWLSETKILVAMSEGHLIMFETGEQKMDIINTFGILESVRDVHTMLTFSRGFICGGQNGSVTIYEKSDDLTYKKSNEYAIPDEASTILNFALSSTEETLICSLSNALIYTLSLSMGDLKSEESQFELLSHPFHHGQITGLDTCIRKPLVVTCSTDRSVRVWNYTECTSDLVKYFPEEAHSVAFHPSGLYILVGFSDKLRLMNLLIDDIRTFRDFAIRGCRECQFSNGGQYFAAIHGSIIQIYNTWTFENVGNLKGHNGKVRSLAWSQDDSKLVSAGMDGAIYEWNLKEMRREGENILKSCSYTCAVCTTDGKTIYAVGSDKLLKEISDSQVVREIDGKATLTQIEISQNNRMMFAATSLGTIRAMKFPFMLAENGEFQEHQGHSSSVNRLRISYDDQYLFSVADDGSLIIWKVSDKERNALKKDREITYADEILITKTDLEDKMSTMSELKSRVEELKMENEYQLRLKDINFNEKIKEVTEKYQEDIEGLKITSTVLKTDKEKEEVRHDEEMDEERNRHTREMENLETSHNMKLMAEYEKYQELQSRTADLQQQWEQELRDLECQKEITLTEFTAQYEAKLTEKQHDIERMQEELAVQVKEFDETTRETEEDADTEIFELKHRCERKLKEEREGGLRLKGENGIMKKKFHSLQNEIESHKGEIQKMFLEEKKLHSIIKSLEKDLAGVKKEITERDETIQDKEKRIYDLKKKNQELEKFKFVLDYKIKELKKQIEPREQDIVSMTKQIKDMDDELSAYSKANRDLELSINDLKLKLKAAEREVQSERGKVKYLYAVMKRFKAELYGCAQQIQEPKILKVSLKSLYHKYCKDFVPDAEHDDHDSAVASSELSETDPQREYARQREHLERTMGSMRNTVSKDQSTHRTDNAKIMQENVALMREINQLQKDIKGLKVKETEPLVIVEDDVKIVMTPLAKLPSILPTI